ncbi:MAG: hypothetical protein ACXQTL_00630, partial [Methanosarcinales archaeon]
LISQEWEDPDRSIEDVCDRLLRQSEQNLGQQLDVIYGLVQERDQIRHKTIRALDYEGLRISNLILQQENLGPYLGYGVQPRISALEKLVASIEQDKVREEREAWKDKAKLTQLWVYLRGKYSEAKTRRQVVEDRY